MNGIVGVIFAIVQVVNTASGLRMVSITGVPDETACEELLSGTTEDDFGGTISIERAECVNELPADYMQAVMNEPIPDVIIISYEITRDGRQWPARHLFYGVAEPFQSERGCNALAAPYRQFSDDLRCINGYQ